MVLLVLFILNDKSERIFILNDKSGKIFVVNNRTGKIENIRNFATSDPVKNFILNDRSGIYPILICLVLFSQS